jgi:repressor LexA
MEEILTRKQVQVLEFVSDFRARSGYSPTLRETAGELGLSSVATVAEHVDALEAKGLVRRKKDRARSLLLTGRGRAVLDRRQAPARGGLSAITIPLLGTIAVPDEIEVPSSLASGSRVYALKVSGSSMVDEGIFDGDYVVVEQKQVPENGDTVVALIDGTQVTLKKFYKETGPAGPRIRLQPANSAMEPIILGPDETIQIQGKVRGVLRVY